MSEAPHGPDNREPKLAEVILIRRHETRDPNELSPAELIDAFLSQYARHPAMKKRDGLDIAERLRREIDPDLGSSHVDQLDERERVWRDAYLRLSSDSMDITIEESDAFDTKDEVYRTITELRRDTRERAKEFAVQRRALAALQDLRLGVLQREIVTDDDDWLALIEQLFS